MTKASSLEVAGGGGCRRCGGEDGALVGLHEAEPVADVVGVIGLWLDGDAKLGTEERAA